MPLDGVLYTVADYVPCLICTDVRLVDQVFIAELTGDVRAAIAGGRLLHPRCHRCGMPLPCGHPLLLCSPGPEMTVWLAPSREPDLTVAGWLLRMLKDRRPSWPADDPAELRVVARSDLLGTHETYPIPREIWDQPAPRPLPAPGSAHLRAAWDHLLVANRGSLAAAPKSQIPRVARGLAHGCILSFQALGDPAHLTEARQAAAQALSAASSPDERARALTIRGAVAVLEHEHRGDAELAREAVAAYREALDCDPGDAVAANGLGTALRLLQSWDDDPASLDASVDALRRSVAQSATDGGDRAVRLNNLGSALSVRGEANRDARDLAEAAAALAEAIALTPPGSPDAAARLNNLGTVQERTYDLTGGEAMLTAAIDSFDAAVAATAPADQAWPGRRTNLATALWLRAAPGDAARATSLSCDAAGGHADDPAGALFAASNWCRRAFQREDWTEVTEAYAHVLAISDLLLERQLTGEARRARLRLVQGLPDLAAFASARLGDGLAAARALEAGRARLLADALELVAAGVEAARAADPALVARREHVVREIDRAERALEDERADGERRAELAAEARRLRVELAEIMGDINAVAPASPGADAAMAGAAGPGPLVYVACTPSGSVASVVTAPPLAAELVWVPELTSAGVDGIFAERDVKAALEAGLPMVGAALAGPLAPLLAGHDAVTFSLPAALARLPLAAAPFTVDGAAHRLVDDHATTLLPAASVARTAADGLAVRRLGGVANPARAGLAPLPFAASELSTAAAHLPAERDDLLVGADATVDGLLATLGRCSHIHLACHGRFRADDPLESCLLLADGDLSLSRMQRVERPEDLSLLVLSACESAQTDTAVLPDELIGLPTAFLRLGARAVIGALWPIPDLPTNLLMARFYRHLADDGLDAGEALRRAQNWLRAATTGQVIASLDGAADGPDAALLRAASRVLGRKFAPDDLPFSEPSVWAGFVSFGAHERGASA